MAQLTDDRSKMNTLRGVIMKAQDEDVISEEEAGFIVTLANRFRADIENKTRALYALQGEIAQLKTNERVMIDIIQNLVGAQQRAKDREKMSNEIKKAKEEAKQKKVDEEKDSDK